MRRRFAAVFAILTVVSMQSFGGALAAAPSHAVAATPSPSPTASLSPSPSPTTEPTAQQQTAAQQPAAKIAAAAAPQPKGNTLFMPSIGFQAPVTTVGVTADNAIDVPAGLQVGWWNGSAQPGTPGAVFLDGHVDGVFKRLSTVAVGQTISLFYGGQTYSYRIVQKEVVPLAGIDMTRALSVYGGAAEGLNIMTCAGTYIPSQGTYDQRLVVYAVRV